MAQTEWVQEQENGRQNSGFFQFLPNEIIEYICRLLIQSGNHIKNRGKPCREISRRLFHLSATCKFLRKLIVSFELEIPIIIWKQESNDIIKNKTCADDVNRFFLALKKLENFPFDIMLSEYSIHNHKSPDDRLKSSASKDFRLVHDLLKTLRDVFRVTRVLVLLTSNLLKDHLTNLKLRAILALIADDSDLNVCITTENISRGFDLNESNYMTVKKGDGYEDFQITYQDLLPFDVSKPDAEKYCQTFGFKFCLNEIHGLKLSTPRKKNQLQLMPVFSFVSKLSVVVSEILDETQNDLEYDYYLRSLGFIFPGVRIIEYQSEKLKMDTCKIELNSVEAEQSFHNFKGFILPSTCLTVTIDWRFLNSISNCKYIKQLRILMNGPISENQPITLPTSQFALRVLKLDINAMNRNFPLMVFVRWQPSLRIFKTSFSNTISRTEIRQTEWLFRDSLKEQNDQIFTRSADLFLATGKPILVRAGQLKKLLKATEMLDCQEWGVLRSKEDIRLKRVPTIRLSDAFIKLWEETSL